MGDYDSSIFAEQIDAVAKQGKEMDLSYAEFQAVLKLPELDLDRFNDALSKLARTIVTLTEETAKPIVGPNNTPVYLAGAAEGNPPLIMPENMTSNPGHNSKNNGGLSWPITAVVIACIVVAGVLAYAQILAVGWVILTMVGGGVVLGFDFVKLLAAYFMKPSKEAEMTEDNRLEIWIKNNLDWCRTRYLGAYMLIDIQSEAKNTVTKNWLLPGQKRSNYSREAYFQETLPTTILARIDPIIISCRKNLWNRTKFLSRCITQVNSPTAGKIKA